MKQNPALYFFVLLLVPFLSHSQYIIRGKIFSTEEKEPLPFVPVIIKGTTTGAQTDFDGNYVIKTNTLKDSIVAIYVGYKRMARPINPNLKEQEINFPMSNEGGQALEEVEIKAGENPAHRIIRNAVRNKPKNDKDNLIAYEYEAYNKLE